MGAAAPMARAGKQKGSAHPNVVYELDRLGFVGVYGRTLKKCFSVGNRASFGPDGYGSMPSATHHYIIIE